MEKYPPDSLPGAYWERVLPVGFYAQRSLDVRRKVREHKFRLVRLLAFASNKWDNDLEVM